MIQIALIDDGVNAHMLLNPEKLIGDFIVDSDSIKVRERTKAEPILTLHGTTSARIIELYEKEVLFISINIFGQRELETKCDRLVAALEWCGIKKVPLIHMSVGTRQLSDYDKVRTVIARMLQQGQIIVAAGSNKGLYTMPADFGGVLGVVAEWRLENNAFVYYNHWRGVQIGASSRHCFINENGISENTMIANSFAAPTVTAAASSILNTINRKISVPQLFRMLIPNKKYIAFRPDFIEDALFLNMSGNLLQSKSFFFYSKEITEEQFVHTDIMDKEGRKCLVFLPAKEEEKNRQILNYLQEKLHRFYGVLFCGNLESQITENIENCLIWSEQNCGIYHMKETRCKQKPNCPIVLIKTKALEGVALVCELQKHFRDKGYQCITASTQAYSYLYGFEYIPFDVKKEKIVPYLEGIYQPDIILIWLYESEELVIADEKDWYCIVLGDGNFMEEKNIRKISTDYTKKMFDVLCEDIISYFS